MWTILGISGGEFQEQMKEERFLQTEVQGEDKQEEIIIKRNGH